MHEAGDEGRLSTSSYQASEGKQYMQKQWTTFVDCEKMSHTANKRDTCNVTFMFRSARMHARAQPQVAGKKLISHLIAAV